MTASKYERSRLLSFRTLFVSLGQLLAIAGTAGLIKWGGGGAHGYAIMAYVMGLVIVSAMIASFFGTAKAPHLEVRAKPETQLDTSQIALLWANKPFVLLLAAKIFQFLSFASVAGTQLLFMLNVLGIGYTGQIQLAIVQNIVVAVSMPLWLALERRMGKRNAYLIGIAFMCANSLSWVFADNSITTVGLLARGVLGGLGSGGMILLSISMLADTLAYDRELTGLHREGLLSSIAAVIEKTAFALGVAVVGAFLAAAHYIPTKNGQIVTQPTSAVTALYVAYSLLPLALFACNAACIWFYTLGARATTPVPVADIAAEAL